MVVQTYPDGSELTVTEIAASAVVGTALGVGAFLVINKVQDKFHKRWLKKHNYPQEVIDRY